MPGRIRPPWKTSSESLFISMGSDAKRLSGWYHRRGRFRLSCWWTRAIGGQGASSGGGLGASRGRGTGASAVEVSNTSVARASETPADRSGIRGGWSPRPSPSGGQGAAGSSNQGTSGCHPGASAGAGPSTSGGSQVEASGDIGGPRTSSSQCKVCGKGDLSGTKLMRCGQCRAVIYCSTKCQHVDLKSVGKSVLGNMNSEACEWRIHLSSTCQGESVWRKIAWGWWSKNHRDLQGVGYEKRNLALQKDMHI